MDIRKATVSRVTGETQIEIQICLDGTGECRADTGIGFLTTCFTALHGTVSSICQ